MLLGPLCALLVGLVSGSCSVPAGHYSGVETSIQYSTDDDDSFSLGVVAVVWDFLWKQRGHVEVIGKHLTVWQSLTQVGPGNQRSLALIWGHPDHGGVIF